MTHLFTIDIGLFPFAGLLAGGLLYAVYYWGMRMKCSARAGQVFLLAAMLLTTLCSVVSMALTTERDLPAVITCEPSAYAVQGGADMGSVYHGVAPTVPNPADDRAEQPVVLRAPEVLPTPPAVPAPTFLERLRATVRLLFADAFSVLGALWLLGIGVVLVYFLVQVAYLYAYRRRQTRMGMADGRAIVYETPAGALPFSFGRSVFLPASLDDGARHYVLMHELSHVRHRHFLKLCLLELVLAVSWFNPFVWLMFGEMRMQQEMEVDSDVLRQGVDRRQYQLSLVSVCTQQGKWILMQSAFLGGPLRKRLLFMNTTINPRRAQVLIASTVAVACLLLVLLVTVSCRARQRAKTHPLEGCWEMEFLLDGTDHYAHRFHSRNLKFFGDYGELVLTYNESLGANIPAFSISGMDQRVRHDTLFDAHGHPIDYQLTNDGNRLVWHWQIWPGEENGYPDGQEQLEQWVRIKSDPELIEMFRALSQSDAAPDATHQLNGVWQLDSTIVLFAGILVDRTVTSHLPRYMLVSSPYYMRLALNPSVNDEVWNFAGEGDCGTFELRKNGYVRLQRDVYRINSPDADHFSLSSSAQHTFYHRIAMPDYVRRLFRPALAVAEAEDQEK